VNLSAEDMLVLKKYLLVTVFRYRTLEPNELELYPNFSKEEINSFKGDFSKNLIKILECKSKEEIFEYIDLENKSTNITLFSYLRDILYSYTVFVSSSDCGEDFLIPDKGYASYQGIGSVKKLNATLDLAKKTGDPQLFQIASMLTPHDYSIFPLSSSVAVLTVSPFYKLCMENSPYKIKYPEEAPTLSQMLGFGSREKIRPPKVMNNFDKSPSYTCEINSLSTSDVTFLNSLLLKSVEQYFACAHLERIQETLEKLKGNGDLSFLKTD